MTGILDIAPPEITAETIDIRGTKLKVSGVRAQDWAVLYARFPELEAVLNGQRIEGAPIREFAALIAVISAGLGHIGNAEVEGELMDNTTSDEQTMIVEVVKRLSLPGHVLRPLLFPPVAVAVAGNGAAKVPAFTSPKQSKDSARSAAIPRPSAGG